MPRSASLWALLFALALAVPASGAPGEELRRLVAKSGPAAGTFGLHVMDAKTGEVIFSLAGKEKRIPASTTKLLTTAASWRELGPGHAVVTRVLSASRPGSGGVLDGDLVVRGSGDPTLTVAAEPGKAPGGVDRLARRLRKAGLTAVRGDLVLDARAFAGPLRHPSWPRDQLDRRYCAPVGALSVARGCVTITVRPGKAVGEPARISMSPANGVVKIRNEIRTCAKKSDQVIAPVVDLGSGTIRCRGRVWVKSSGYPAEVSIRDPVPVFGDVFRRALVRAGITIAGRVVVQGEAAAGLSNLVELAREETTVETIARTANHESQNLYAESLLKHLGFVKSGSGSFESGAAAARNVFAKVRLPVVEMTQVDGSGMSRKNLVSPRFLASLLTWMYAQSDVAGFLGTLASGGGKDGTLSRRMKDLGGNVRAKTGTLNGVSALAGYVRGRSGKRVLAFAILVNDRRMKLGRARSFQDEVCRILHRNY